MSGSSDVAGIAQSLIRCPSVTPVEGGALAHLAEALAAKGFRVERPIFSEPGTPDVENLFARWGSASPCLVFAGHTDVVPPGDESRWTHPPFSGVVADGFVWGRGAVDMKGGIAAAVAAAFRFMEARGGELPGSIAFLITGDEEGPSINGTAKLLRWAADRGERFDQCLLGEPTNPEALGDAIKIGRRGSLSATLTVSGRQGHVAYPHLAENPIRGLVRLVSALNEIRLDEGTEHFDPSNLEVVSIDIGNPAFNVIPAEARARLNVRFNDRHTLESLEVLLRRTLDGVGATYTLDIQPGSSESFLTVPGPFVDVVAGAVEAETGRRPALSTSGGTSDARFIKDYCPVVEFGLVGQTMHQVDERVSIRDLEALTAIYGRMLEGYFGASRP